ncbi:MAG: hypothetical protein Q9210_005226 [Variospora velana]
MVVSSYISSKVDISEGRNHSFPADRQRNLPGDQTSYINYIKPLILAEELHCPYVISVIETRDEWYRRIHPERYVPALKDVDPETQKEVIVFESTACMQYLADRFDTDGSWCGRNLWEKASIYSWMSDSSSPTAKYWLYFLKGYPNRQNPESLSKTVAKLSCAGGFPSRPKTDAHPFQHVLIAGQMDRVMFPNFYKVQSIAVCGNNAMAVFTEYGPVFHQRYVYTVFKDSDRHLKAVNNNSGWLMGQLLGSCVGLVSGQEWGTLRSATEKPFLHNCVTSYTTRIEQRTQKHFDLLHATCRLDRGVLNPVEDLRLLPFWIIADILYGDLSGAMEAQLLALIPIRESLFRRMISGKATRFSFYRYLPTTTNRDLAIFKESWKAFNDEAYQRALADNMDVPIVDMYRKVETRTVGLDRVLQTLDEMLFANLDVTIGGLSWNLVHLGAHIRHQSMLRAEVVTAAEDGHRVRSGWDMYLLSPTTLLAASILESARLQPLAAFSVPQAAPTPRTVSGFRVPAGTNFIIDSYAINIRDPFWGEDSLEYRPTRFLEGKRSDFRYRYWRFGFGPRTCMGRHVADLIMKVVLAHVVANYSLSLLDHAKSWERNGRTWISHPTTDMRWERITGRSRESATA